jgi:hypothetical protein
MSIGLERLKKAVSMKPQRKAVDLPDGSEFEYWMTPLTLAERSRAQKQAKSDDATDFALLLLVAKATDENGERLFNAGDPAELRNAYPANVVEALMLQLLADEQEEDEDLDPKPSQPTSKRTAS